MWCNGSTLARNARNVGLSPEHSISHFHHTHNKSIHIQCVINHHTGVLGVYLFVCLLIPLFGTVPYRQNIKLFSNFNMQECQTVQFVSVNAHASALGLKPHIKQYLIIIQKVGIDNCFSCGLNLHGPIIS